MTQLLQMGSFGVGRLVVVSNRVPLPGGKPAAGGLATAMLSALQESGGVWFGWSGETLDGPVGDTALHEQDGITYATLDLNHDEWRGYYEGYANQILWPLFHHRIDLVVFDRSVFEQYEAVNKLFADRLVRLLRPGDTIWVHDYQLIPLGEELRRRGCQQRIGFFLHTPFPAPEILVTLFNHKRLVRSLLSYDLVGLQSPHDLRSFQDYIVQELRDGHTAKDGSVSAFGKTAKAGCFPIGIDPAAFRDLANSPSARRYRDRVQKSLGGCELILSVDRLDYSKGLPERMAAVEMLYERYPDLRGRVTFLQIASPSREDVPQYQVIRHELEGAVGQINGRFADSDWTPVRYVSKTYSQSRLCGLYSLSRVGLVTPLRDGMNLVAKEYIAAQPSNDPGVLVLSRFAGAAHQMDGALIVNPYDRLQVCDAVHRALEMTRDERAERWAALMKGLERNDLAAWRDNFLSALAPDDRATF
jgi:trehalose 6-phosphate synthase